MITYSDDFGSYIAGACNDDTLKRKLSSVQYFLFISKYDCDTHNYYTDYRLFVYMCFTSL